VDFVVVGEGEEAMLDLVNALESNSDLGSIPNIGFNNGDSVRVGPVRPPIADLDTLPLPDKDLFYHEYRGMVNNSYMILGSRGCAYNCSYCWNSVINKAYSGYRFFRKRTPKNIIAELIWAKERYKIKRVTFYDEVFTSDKKWLRELLWEYREKVGLPFFCCVHPSGVDEETIELLTDAGCGAVNMGIQTINTDTRKRLLGRSETNEQIQKAMNLLARTNIFVYTNIMLGLPGQTEEELLENLEFCNKYKADIPAIYWLRYYPGTRIVETARNAGLLSKQEVLAIEESAEYNPYAMKGSTYQKDMAKIGNLILVSNLLPERFVNFLTKHRLYRFAPARNLLFPAIFSIGLFKKLFQRKRMPFHYLSVSEYLAYYFFYVKKSILGFLFPFKKPAAKE